MHIAFDEETKKQFSLDTKQLTTFLERQGFAEMHIRQLRIMVHTKPHGVYKFWNEKSWGIFVPNRNLHIWTYEENDAECHNQTLKFLIYQYRLFLRGELDDLHTNYENRLSVKLAKRFVAESLDLKLLTRRESAETIVEE